MKESEKTIMTDRLLRGIIPEHHFRFSLCEVPALVTEGVQIHKADPLSGWLLAEALCATTLLSVILADEENLTLRWDYPGPAKVILSDVNEKAEVRVMGTQTQLLNHASSIGEALGGDGVISAISSFPRRHGRTGTTPAMFQDISRDLGHLLSFSFGVESAVAVGLIAPVAENIQFSAALGLLLQPLPGADLERFDLLRNRVEAPDFRTWLETQTRSPEEILEWLGEKAEIQDEVEPRYACHCTRERVEAVLRMMPVGELAEMWEKDEKASVSCQFCAKEYLFTKEELALFIQQGQGGRA